MLSPEELTGAARSHIAQYDAPRFAAHPRAAEAFLDMRAAACKVGFDLRPFSSFRDLKTQTKIWARKMGGVRPLYDAEGREIDASALSPAAKMRAILGWSAAPGASRHHWGTEIDVVDGRAVDAGHRVALLPYETAEGGVFAELHAWLDGAISAYGFHRPYDADPARGGMHPEPWHLSFAEVSGPALAALTPEIVRAALAPLDFVGKDALLSHLDEVFVAHVRAVAEPPAAGTPLRESP